MNQFEWQVQILYCSRQWHSSPIRTICLDENKDESVTKYFKAAINYLFCISWHSIPENIKVVWYMAHFSFVLFHKK